MLWRGFVTEPAPFTHRSLSLSGTGNKPPCLKCSGDQKKGNHGSILHYFYKNSLGQSIHSHLRQVTSESKVMLLSSVLGEQRGPLTALGVLMLSTFRS